MHQIGTRVAYGNRWATGQSRDEEALLRGHNPETIMVFGHVRMLLDG